MLTGIIWRGNFITFYRVKPLRHLRRVMKTQWQIYQELELISDAVPQPKANLLAQLIVPLRRSFSNSFVRELADRHRIFLFNRCLQLRELQVTDPSSTNCPDSKAMHHSEESEAQASNQPLKLLAPTSQSRNILFWWIWEDAQ
jgi:hypothetical protein